MNCAAFERWLDDGMPSNQAPVARAHAASCARCAAALRVTLELDELLRAPAARAPESFTTRVLDRVVEIEHHGAALRPAPTLPVFDWWVRAAAHPAVVLAAALAALVVWQQSAVLAGTRKLFWLAAHLAMRAWSEGGSITFPRDPVLGAALGVALLPLVALASWGLYSWIERLAMELSGMHGPRAIRGGSR